MVCNGSFIHLIIYLLLSEFMIPKAPPFRSPPLLNPIFLEMLWPSIIVLAFGPFLTNSLLLSLPATHVHHTRVIQCCSTEPLLLTLPGNSWESFLKNALRLSSLAIHEHACSKSGGAIPTSPSPEVPQGYGFFKKLLLLVTSSLPSKDLQR